MILRDNGEAETEDDSDSVSDEIPELEDIGIEYPVDGEILFVRHALHAQIKVEDLEKQFDLDVWLHMRMEGDLYPFDAGSDSRSNPFDEGWDDAIQASHRPLLH
ncbi:hypothetical protein Adt_39227 [Abeliophyllum distichum]|uniref:Uncharacterized protein n=1 Tax=Abeliophyllum distichum TaxID=126358 RepID=A0ABD1Q4K2_9LAMI